MANRLKQFQMEQKHAEAMAMLESFRAEMRNHPESKRLALLDRMENFRENRGTLHNYNKPREIVYHEIGSAEIPAVYTPRMEAESAASVETRDGGTNYELSPL